MEVFDVMLSVCMCGVWVMKLERMEDQWLQRSQQQLMGRQRQNFQAMQQAITGILADSATEDEGI
jgi:hypothetical protein